MWLSPQQAPEAGPVTLDAAETRYGYDITTARGSMKPATHVAITDWRVDDAIAARFTGRWNAAYHAIEDRIGSRLMKDLESESTYAALHVMTDASHLNLEMFGAPLTDPEGLSVAPVAVAAFEVVLLTEA
jgi:hypothetical protein